MCISHCLYVHQPPPPFRSLRPTRTPYKVYAMCRAMDLVISILLGVFACARELHTHTRTHKYLYDLSAWRADIVSSVLWLTLAGLYGRHGDMSSARHNEAPPSRTNMHARIHPEMWTTKPTRRRQALLLFATTRTFALAASAAAATPESRETITKKINCLNMKSQFTRSIMNVKRLRGVEWVS